MSIISSQAGWIMLAGPLWEFWFKRCIMVASCDQKSPANGLRIRRYFLPIIDLIQTPLEETDGRLDLVG